MNKSVYVRFSLTLFLIVSMLAPMSALAAGDKGKKYFVEGMKAESAEQWDKAAEQYALAVTEAPKNSEYRLHYTRALFNASQMFMKKGTAQASEKDYEGAYNAFRKAYAFDPTNELAKAEMARMLRLQEAFLNGENPEEKEKRDKSTPDVDLKLVKTSYANAAPQDTQVPQRLEKLRDVPFPGGVDLQFIVKELAKDLDLNVLFDSESFRSPQKINIELKNVTAAKALDYIFLQQGLFFQKVGPRTILVASQNRRQNFQQLVLRTFYLANASPKDVAKVVQTAIPAQPGRTPTIVLTDDATNSLTIRDTEENIRLMSKLISSLDKDRAEVVMDVQIYEVNKSDLLQLGNQIGDSGSLVSLGGTTRGVVGLGGNDIYGGTAGTTAASIIPRAFGVGLVVPAVNLVALQKKNNSNLIASTQIHAFNNEDSSARIGQRVPVRSASFAPVGTTGTNNGNNNFVGDVINYEQIGLTLKFKPIVFPNQDVQVAMEIESKDVSGAQTLTPTFTERTVKGTARVQNNKTLLLASIAQNNQSEGREGLPLLGLIPILGRLFTAPTKDNRQVDIVIAVTPRVIRAPVILPEDEVERPTGSLAVPTSGSLEAMIIQEDREELLAAARRLPTTTAVQLPDQKAADAPVYVKSDGQPAAPQNNGTTAQVSGETNAVNETDVTKAAPPAQPISFSSLQPIDSGVRTLNIAQTSDVVGSQPPKPIETAKTVETAPGQSKSGAPTAEMQFLPALPEMKKGEKTKIAVLVKSAAAFRSAVIGLNYDDQKIAVRSVSFGDVFGAELANTNSNPFFNQGGKTFVTLSSPKDAAQNASGVLAYIEVEALTDGKHQIAFNGDIMNLMTADGRNFSIKF